MPGDFPSQCILCGHRAFRLVHALERGRIVRCAKCRLLSYHPIPSRDELQALYDLSYREGRHSYEDLYRARGKKVRCGHRCLEVIEGYRPQAPCGARAGGSRSGPR